jgi:hypothetical protein
MQLPVSANLNGGDDPGTDSSAARGAVDLIFIRYCTMVNSFQMNLTANV